MRIGIVICAALVLSGCQTVGSLYADAEAKCNEVGWESAECLYAQRRAEAAALAPQGANAAAIQSGTRLMMQRPYVPR